jgi:DNA-binding NarL/FixJ family response regulator
LELAIFNRGLQTPDEIIDPDDPPDATRSCELIWQGKSNSEIATELVLSKRTVETHVSHILSKLGLSNRAQIMRWTIDHGLRQTRT